MGQQAHLVLAGADEEDLGPPLHIRKRWEVGEQGSKHSFHARLVGRAVGELGCRADAPRGVDFGEQRMDAGCDQRAAIGFLVGALDDLHA